MPHTIDLRDELSQIKARLAAIEREVKTIRKLLTPVPLTDTIAGEAWEYETKKECEGLEVEQ